jgi:hypothetical protein
LTKTTTIEDIKYAMLTAAASSSKGHRVLPAEPPIMDDYGVFEKWQGNERLLDGRIKIYKLIRLWQSLPGDQLSQVQFLIKRKRAPNPTTTTSTVTTNHKLSQRNKNVVESRPHKFDLCTLSPSLQKTWNYEKCSRKSSYVNKQLKLVSQADPELVSTYSSSDEDQFDDDDYVSDNSDTQLIVDTHRRRYASIKRYHRSKRSTIKKCHQMKSAYVDLVDKQSEIIEKQMRELSRTRDSAERMEKSEELAKLFGDYLSVETCLEQKLAKIEQLKLELNTLMQQSAASSASSSAVKQSISKASKRLHGALELETRQSDKLKTMDVALTRLDDIIGLKQKSIQSLENELQRLEELSLANDEKVVTSTNRIMSKSASTSSTTSSQSSLFTSISSISSQSSLLLGNQQQQQQQQMQMQMTNVVASNKSQASSSSSYVCNDNESDTGISSANSEDFSTQQLETLV